MPFLFLLAVVIAGEGDTMIIKPYLPVGVDCGTSIRPDRLTELVQFFIERNARNELQTPFSRSTEKVCTDVCIHIFLEFNVDKEDILKSVRRDKLVPILRDNFCINLASFHEHGRLMIDIDEDMKRTPKQCQALRDIENYCEARECDDFHRQCDMVVRREWCRLQNQNAYAQSTGALDCFVYDNMHKVPPSKKMLDHDLFDKRVKYAVSFVHKQHAAALTAECKAAHLSSECTFDEVYEQKTQQHLRLQASIHDGAQCTRVNEESPRWMEKVDCKCAVDKPCTKRIVAREGRIEYHRTRFIDLVMLLQSSAEENESHHVPKIRLLDVESGGFFRDQVEILFHTFFGSGAVNGLPPLERSLDISDYSLYANVRNEYFRAYQWCEMNAANWEKLLLLGYQTWRFQDLMYFVKKLLQWHSNAMPLIIHDDVAQNTLWVMDTLLRRIDAMDAPPTPDQADVPHEHSVEYDFDGNENKEQNVDEDAAFENNHMPPLLSRRASAKEYINALIQLKLSREIRLLLNGLIERQHLSQKSIGSALPQDGKGYDRRRLGIRLQYYTFLSSPTEWDEYMLEEASDAGVEFRRREKEFVVQACREYRIDAVTSYIPTGHHDQLKGMKHWDFLNGGLFSECSLQHVLARQYAIRSIDDYRRNHHLTGHNDIMAQMELDQFEEDFLGEDEKKKPLHKSGSARRTLSTVIVVYLLSA
eukprot:GEMP01021618.1.p1 GENE.GEMP01021618.1~~GEMP01021618.1.p1  ORF type:complete len:702 (+),score=160.43 GEMP01021618.1:227-2332(+)